MAVNVREVVRDQQFLMPPSAAEWLPEDHLAWFVLDVVGELDLSGSYSDLRDDGRGGSSYDPAMMLGVLIYAYCVGERSSRRIEARLVEDVAFRVLAGNQCPDHATLARFRCRHEIAIAELFSQVLGLCVAEGLVAAGVVAIDGTKVEANAWAWSNRTRRQIAAEILAEADRPMLSKTTGSETGAVTSCPSGGRIVGTDRPGCERRCASWTPRALRTGRPIWPNGPARRPRPAATFPVASPPSPGHAKDRPVNTTDPDSRMLRARNRFVQGYNAQAAASEDHIVVAAEITNAANHTTQLAPLVAASTQNLTAAGVERGVGTFVADAGYWSVPNATLEVGAEVLIVTVALNNGITDPDDPRVQARHAVLERVERGELTLRAAGTEMGISDARAGQLLAARRAPEPEALVVRGQPPRRGPHRGLRARLRRRAHTPGPHRPCRRHRRPAHH